MPSHTASRDKVCACCWNRRGKKVERVIKDGSEIERALDQYVVPGYKADSLHAPCGICVDCWIRLMEYANKMPNPRKLTIPVGFVLGQISVEDIDGQQCSCHIWSITSTALLWILCSCRSNDIQAILGICWTRVTLTPDTEQQCFKMWKELF